MRFFSWLLPVTLVSARHWPPADADVAPSDGDRHTSAVPVFSLSNVGSLEFFKALRLQGIVEVADVPGLQEANMRALSALAECGQQEDALDSGFLHKRLLDGSDRWTLAADQPASQVVPPSLRPRCASLEEDLAALRSTIGDVGAEFIREAEPQFGGLPTASSHGGFGSLLAQGRTLEHFHLYRGAGEDSGETALPVHTDKGAFLVLSKALTFLPSTRGTWQNPAKSEFVVQGHDGGLVNPALGENSLILLMGDAMQEFLQASTRSPPHTVDLRALPPRALRAWHGRMYLFPDVASNIHGQVAKDLFLAGLPNASKASHGFGLNMRGAVDKRRLYMDQLQTECDTAVVSCWMQDPVCVSTCADGTLQQCLLPSREKGNCGPQAMNDQCAWRCKNPDIPSAADSGFCNKDMRTSMYMGGFTSLAAPNKACIVLFFNSWVLDTPFKFVIGCFGVGIMGVFTQALIRARAVLHKKCKGRGKIPDSVMFGLNVMMGWAMMLVAMTYSVELFLSATLGLMIGNYFLAQASETKILGSPCCNAVNDGQAHDTRANTVSSDSAEAWETMQLIVDGMTCGNCVATIEKAVLDIPGVVQAVVLLAEKRAMIRYQAPATAEQIVEAIDDVGFIPTACAANAPEHSPVNAAM
eukprot:TRINITY_DN80352_c0_g1_i1.p1 TRINITY_DN80352_c0_g1~~TRINITY_DN80352_c0_g1_i1.p1  ORF type:complete len:641 (-),score=132.60 TRINITY_DN80352_c0_g1_i1:405-2327(-)